MNALAGTRQLLRLALRRDRIVVPLWVILLGVLPAITASAYATLYPDAASRAALTAATGSNPSIRLLYGPAFDLSTAGGFTAWRFGAFLSLFVALACVFTVTRHTRQEEDSGRQELLSSTVTGRSAALTAGLLTGGLAALATGLVATLSLAGGKLPLAGSVAFGASVTLVGWVACAVAAITAQLAEYSRTANGLACATLGVMFLLRAVGDSSRDIGWLSWLSPLGWSSQVRPYAHERWWVLLLPLATTAVLGLVAYRLLARRDVGMGLLPARLGPAAGAPGLDSPLALAWRLHRGTLFGWLAGFALAGALFGSMAAGIGDVVGDSAQTREMVQRMGGGSGLVDAFLAVMAGMFGMIAAMYSVQAALRMRSEEVALRLEPLLATGTRRLRWAASHLVFPFLGSGLLLAVAGTALGLLHGLRVHDVSVQLPRVLGSTVAQLPAVWVVAGISLLVFGFLPGASVAAGWGVASAFLLVSLYGPAIRLPQAVLDLSPFTHVPKFPSAAFTPGPFLWLSGMALVTLFAGLAGFRRRDIG
ncbi:ABC transporter permease [Amycolatopsis rhizosphaerae]|uniref:ABC transporter permease n=1 Tax=Amycolatopsis rhizosphaerae TaxID=2053003 RepID=A0A558CP85_9PSEU|nr:ABC transporter permease [Amycolatopsis rhizosphaerae]TVT50590.1 ABC transporter permease [Amycolatopsis rhizosphaerae]